MPGKADAHDCATHPDRLITLRVTPPLHDGRGAAGHGLDTGVDTRSEVRQATGVQTIVAAQGQGWPDDAARARVPEGPAGCLPRGVTSPSLTGARPRPGPGRQRGPG